MDGVRNLGGVFGPMQVTERNGGRGRGGEAFREALEHEAGDASGEPRRRAGEDRQTPLRTGLQSRPENCRKDGQNGAHIDVFA
jgi:hypothetical protein